jgi:hypothetical protein
MSSVELLTVLRRDLYATDRGLEANLKQALDRARALRTKT